MAETLEVLAILFGVTALVTLPLAVITGLPLLDQELEGLVGPTA